MRIISFPSGVRLIALVEAAKALLVLLAGFGLLALVHHDVEAVASRLIERLHLNAANRYPQIFIDAASRLTDTRLWLLAVLAMIYAIARGVEAYGLWNDRRWAEWFALLSGGIYLPVELYELRHHITGIKIGALIINIVIVAFMGWRLRRQEGRTGSSLKADIATACRGRNGDQNEFLHELPMRRLAGSVLVCQDCGAGVSPAPGRRDACTTNKDTTDWRPDPHE